MNRQAAHCAAFPLGHVDDEIHFLGFFSINIACCHLPGFLSVR
jgi:hypothetical protein